MCAGSRILYRTEPAGFNPQTEYNKTLTFLYTQSCYIYTVSTGVTLFSSPQNLASETSNTIIFSLKAVVKLSMPP